MTAKSVVEIDVQDDRFQAFLSSFKEYQAALENLPEEWRLMGVATGNAAKQTDAAANAAGNLAEHFDKSLAELQQINAQLAGLNANTDTLARNGDSFRRSTDGAKGFLEGGAKAAGKMASDIKDATLSFMKWGTVLGFFSGLVGAGGLFGINRMALGAGQQRFTSMGLNTTAGGLASSAANFTPALGNPVGTLGSIRDAQQDLSRRWAFTSLGVNPQGDPAEMLPQMMRNARDIFNQTGGTVQGAEARGLTQFFTLDDLNRMKNMSDAEIDAMGKRAEADRRAFQITDATLKQWQDFDVQVGRSEQEIRKAFITGLSPLAPQLSQLSEAVATFITHMLNSPQVGQWINSAATGLQHLGEYLTSSEFQKDADEFLTTVGKFSRALGNIVSWIGNKFGGSDESSTSPSGSGQPGLQLAPSLLGPGRELYLTDNGFSSPGQAVNQPGRTVAERNNNPGNLRKSPMSIGTKDGFAQFPDVETGYRASQYQLLRYASGATFGAPVDTVKGIINKWAPRGDGNDPDSYIKSVIQLMNKDGSKFNENQHLNLNDTNTMAKLLAAMSRVESGKSAHSEKEIRLMITNATGGNAIVSNAQLGGN